MDRITLKGFSEVDESMVTRVNEIASKQADKCGHHFSELSVELHLRESQKEGKPKFGVHAHIKTPQKTYSSEVTDWDLVASVHAALDNVTTVIEKEMDKKNDHRHDESIRKAD